MKKYTVFIAIAIAVASCTEKLAVPAAKHEEGAKAKYPDITLAQLSQGHELYKTKCGTCHHAHNPTEYSDQKWEKIMPIMGKKAKLTDEEYNLVSRYVFGMREADKKKS